jgi:alpha-beta hydrolase superfamily lysophospholipase
MGMSNSTNIALKQNDGYIIRVTHYAYPEQPKASILILHGMAEHQERYQAFAQFLVNCGYDVFTYNHRGHGVDNKLCDLGFIRADKGDQLLIQDAISVSEYIEKNNRTNKFYLFGHSMGSIIARNVIQAYSKYNGVVICGTSYPPRFLINMGLMLSTIIKCFKGAKHISPYLNNLIFGGKKYTSLSSRTAFDWLSRSNPIVGAYIHDPYCGFVCTTSFYHDLFKLIQQASKKSLIKLTRADLPMFVIAGERDPVSGYGKDTLKYVSLLKKAGFTNVTTKLYPECRHELLNELNKDEIYNDIQQWFLHRK